MSKTGKASAAATWTGAAQDSSEHSQRLRKTRSGNMSAPLYRPISAQPLSCFSLTCRR